MYICMHTWEFQTVKFKFGIFYIRSQVILAFWLVLAYDLLEGRRTIDVTNSKFFHLCFKMAESFENLDVLFWLGKR